MMNNPLHVFLILLLFSALAACSADEPVGSVAPPRGTWSYEAEIDGGTRLHRSYLTLNPLTGGALVDTIFRREGDSLVVDSLRHMFMTLSVVGDGFQRVIETTDTITGAGDTVLRYWFFIRGDNTLRFRRGMRFEGTQALLPGSWRVSEQDRPLLEEWCNYTFGEGFNTGTVRIVHGTDSTAPVESSHIFVRNGDTLRIDGAPCNWGSRYEVVPTSALYLTSFADKVYVKE